MGDVTSKVGSGSTPKGSNYSVEGVPFFRSQNVHNDGLHYEDIKYINGDIHASMSGTHVSGNDLLLNITGGSIGRCAVVPSDFKEGNVSQHVCIIRPILCLSEYIHAYIISDLFWDSMKLTGSGREGLPKYNLEQMALPLPPLTEQARIIDAIHSYSNLIQSVCDNCNELKIQINATKSKILDLAMQGKLVPQDPSDEPAADMMRRVNTKAEIIGDNPHSRKWVQTTLKHVCEFERGITFPSDAKEFSKADSNIACIRTANVHRDLDLSSLWYINRSYLKNNTYKLIRVGDIIMSTANSKELVGRSIIIRELPFEMTFGGFVTAIRTRVLLPKFLHLFLCDKVNKGDFSKIATQTTNIANLNTKILSDVLIAFPNFNEQKRIVAKIEEIYNILDEIEASLQA